MPLLTKDDLHDAARRVGMVESNDGATMRSIGQARGLTVSDALAWAAEVERMVVAKLTGSHETRYQHYKGGVYTLVCEATMEADLTPHIVYKAADGSTWCRPKSVFFETVEVDGTLVPRFSVLP